MAISRTAVPLYQLASLLSLTMALAVGGALPAQAATESYSTGFMRWRAAESGFNAWERSGVTLAANGTLQLELASATRAQDPYPPAGYAGRNFYNGGRFLVGEATSPVLPTKFGWREAIASWNADTPTGTWIETQIRAQIGTRWTKWYNLGVWAADSSTVERHSVNAQGDADGTVATDTLLLSSKKAAARAVQLKIRLFSANSALPTIRTASLAYSTTPVKPTTLAPGNPARWNRVLEVPECSQMVYPDGGEVWCSPTSTAMVLSYWANNGEPCATVVQSSVAGVYDWLYNGHGNWPFNTAYAATRGYEGYVARFNSMAQIEQWVAAGVPVIISYSWRKNELSDAPITSSNGHLALVVGFDAAGNPVVNDPAAASNDTVQRTYGRAQLEILWLQHSGGTVYLIYPPGYATPL